MTTVVIDPQLQPNMWTGVLGKLLPCPRSGGFRVWAGVVVRANYHGQSYDLYLQPTDIRQLDGQPLLDMEPPPVAEPEDQPINTGYQLPLL